MNTYTEFFEKAQSEFLNGLKQAQELNVKALESFTALVAKAPAVDLKDASTLSLPTPSEVVERTFAFTTEMIEAQKAYLRRVIGAEQHRHAGHCWRELDGVEHIPLGG